MFDANGTYVVQCPFCGAQTEVPLSKDEVEKVMHSPGCIQDVIPYAEPWVRELFVTGMCKDCQKRMFGAF